jgi:hypothetical protein
VPGDFSTFCIMNSFGEAFVCTERVSNYLTRQFRGFNSMGVFFNVACRKTLEALGFCVKY